MTKSKSNSGDGSQNTPQQEAHANPTEAVDFQALLNRLKSLAGKVPWLAATFAQIVAAVEAVLTQTQQKMASAPSTCDKGCHEHCTAILQQQRELQVQALANNLCLQHCLDECCEE